MGAEGGRVVKLARHPYRRERIYLRGVLRYGRTHLMREARKGAAGSRVGWCRTEEQEALLQLLDRHNRMWLDPEYATFSGLAEMLRGDVVTPAPAPSPPPPPHG